jgi:hypothetical protein
MIWPDPVTPGSDCVRDIAGARLATERERECVPESGEVVRGRYGREGRDVVGAHEGALGVVGLGSVLRRRYVGFWSKSMSSLGSALGGLSRREGTGEDRNASIRSVSGTGSMLCCGKRHVGLTGCFET